MIRQAREEDIDRVLELFNKEVNITGNIYKYDKKNLLEYIKNNNCGL